MKFIAYLASARKKSNLAAAIFIALGTSLFFPFTAQAAYGHATVICSNGTDTRSYQIGWDNSFIGFSTVGFIPAYYCTGGYAGAYRTFVSSDLSDLALGYYQGITPPVVEPTPVAPSDTQTVVVDSATVETSTSQSSETTTQTSQTETPTVTPTQTDSSTSLSDTNTIVAPIDGSTATTQPAPAPAPAPDPAPLPPEPIREPDPIPQPAPDPLPTPDPIPEPAPAPDPIPVDPPAPVEEPPAPVPDPIPVEEEKITLENGVVLSVEVATALQLFENPTELLSAIFTNPGEALTAFANIGADMSAPVREKAQETVIAAVIVGQIATQSAVTASLTTYRRKI